MTQRRELYPPSLSVYLEVMAHQNFARKLSPAHLCSHHSASAQFEEYSTDPLLTALPRLVQNLLSSWPRSCPCPPLLPRGPVYMCARPLCRLHIIYDNYSIPSCYYCTSRLWTLATVMFSITCCRPHPLSTMLHFPHTT